VAVILAAGLGEMTTGDFEDIPGPEAPGDKGSERDMEPSCDRVSDNVEGDTMR
jgi:hypothetical protein